MRISRTTSRSDFALGASDARRAHRGGYSLVEAMICVVIVGGMFAAAIHTLGAVRLGERQVSERARAHLLAQALLDDILRRDYEAVDDDDGWSASPPARRDGTALDGFDGWTRSVAVDSVVPEEPDRTATGETGLKRITVTVHRGEALLAEVAALRGRGLHKERPTGAIAP